MAGRRTGRVGLTTGVEELQRHTRVLKETRKATGKKGPTKAGRYYRKSYLLTMDIIEGVRLTAEEHQVGISELVRWALQYVLDGVRQGEIEIPIREEVVKRKIEHSC